MVNMGSTDGWVLQFCHGYSGPFLDCARQYAVLFKDTPLRVCTVYLTGEPKDEVVAGSASDEVIFLDFSSREIRGLKLNAISAIRKIASSREFRLCIAHRFKPTYVALIGTKLPVIGVQHAFGVYSRFSRKALANVFRKRLMLLGVSNSVRDDVRAGLLSWPESRIETLYNRLDVKAVQAEQVTREEARHFLGLPEDAWVIGNVGRLHPDKDQATLIRGFANALPALPTGSLLFIMGTGRLEHELKDLATQLEVHDRVRFGGQIPGGRSYFKAFDVFVLSSDHEPFGMVLLEAMAAGIPIISSDCGGAREVIGDCGVLFPLSDERRLAECMLKIAERGEQELAAQQRDCHRRLTNVFSDASAYAHFWSMPWLADIEGRP